MLGNMKAARIAYSLVYAASWSVFMDTVTVYSKKLGKNIEVDINPTEAIIHASQETGAGTRMLVSPEPPTGDDEPWDNKASRH